MRTDADAQFPSSSIVNVENRERITKARPPRPHVHVVVSQKSPRLNLRGGEVVCSTSLRPRPSRSRSAGLQRNAGADRRVTRACLNACGASSSFSFARSGWVRGIPDVILCGALSPTARNMRLRGDPVGGGHHSKGRKRGTHRALRRRKSLPERQA
jgi:hypothetical protein